MTSMMARILSSRIAKVGRGRIRPLRRKELEERVEAPIWQSARTVRTQTNWGAPRTSISGPDSGRDQSRSDTDVIHHFLREARIASNDDASTLPALVAELQREFSRILERFIRPLRQKAAPSAVPTWFASMRCRISSLVHCCPHVA